MTSLDDDVTDLRCSRCQATVVSVPMILNREDTISVALCLDLCRISIQHGYVCEGKEQ